MEVPWGLHAYKKYLSTALHIGILPYDSPGLVSLPPAGGETATVEYAVVALEVTDIVVCGHSNCGAMSAVANGTCMTNMPAVADWLRYADSARVVNEARPHDSAAAKIEAMVRENVIAQLANLQTHPSVRLALKEGRLALHGWYYDIESGVIEAYDQTAGDFGALAGHPSARAAA